MFIPKFNFFLINNINKKILKIFGYKNKLKYLIYKNIC